MMKRMMIILLIGILCTLGGCSKKAKETDLTFIGLALKDASHIEYHNASKVYVPDLTGNTNDYELVSDLCKIYNKKQTELYVDTLEDTKLSEVYLQDDSDKYYFIIELKEKQTVRSRECDRIIVNLNDSTIYLGYGDQAAAKLYWDHNMREERKDVEKHYDKIIAILDFSNKKGEIIEENQ